MIEFMPESGGNIVGVRAAQKLTHADYERVFVPHLEELIRQHGKLRVLFFMDETFRGWDLESVWDNTRFDVRHRADFEKIAMVGAPVWEEWCVKFGARFLMKGQMRSFARDRLAEAWDWIRA